MKLLSRRQLLEGSAAGLSVKSAKRIIAVTPAGSGTVTVTVATPVGTTEGN